MESHFLQSLELLYYLAWSEYELSEKSSESGCINNVWEVVFFAYGWKNNIFSRECINGFAVNLVCWIYADGTRLFN